MSESEQIECQYAFNDSNIRGYPQHDNTWWEPSGHYLSILLNDEEEFKQVKNYIITDRLITEHVMGCDICLNEGLNQCKDLAVLPGVYS